MGMAASQARYLALTARKTNIEYEGQQINQARLALANQSANLFNQMMDVGVPTPPSITDYTTLQYSFSDGFNTEVLSNYYQLGNADSEYNYVVTTYHNEKVYQGSRKKMNDPQVQTTWLNHYSYNATSVDNNRNQSVTKAVKQADGTFLIQGTDGTTATYRPVTIKDEEMVRAINKGLGNTEENPTVDLSNETVLQSFHVVDGSTPAEMQQLIDIVGYTAAANGKHDLSDPDGVYTGYRQLLHSDTDLIAQIKVADSTGTANKTDDDIISGYYYNPGTKTFVTADDYNSANDEAVTYAVEDLANKYYTNGTGFVTKADYDAKKADATLHIAKTGQGIDEGTEQTYYTDGKNFVTRADLEEAVAAYDRYIATGKREANQINIMSVTNNATFNNYTAVGNCQLTELQAGDFERDEALKTEIDQIIKDMKGPNGDKTAAANLLACFDTDSNGDLVYKGGIYSFQMGGTTYYTTRQDLETCAPSSIVDNDIDVQQEKLRYYNGIYVETRVEDTQKALLETDGQGRFKTVKFEDDNISYVLNTEQVTDEDAYNDAMNRYYYENAQYEHKLQEINAKTEIIQAQDRTLELRMKQLETEQSALQNEMEAVKKVVSKNIENGFKTFGG